MSANDAIFDTIAYLWFDGKVAKPHAKRVGKLVRDFVALEATPDEIVKRHKRYKEAWPTMECTAEGLIKHWNRFDGRAAAPKKKTALDAWKEATQP